MSLALIADEAAEADRIELMPMLVEIGRRARAAQRVVGLARAERKSAALREMAAAIRAAKEDVLLANATDLVAANHRGQTAAFIDRLTLTEAGVESIAQAVEDIAAFPDPVGRVLATFTRPNRLVIERVATPLGVIGVIFESRPNVTADAGALCLKAGNATILRAGSDSFESAMAIRAAMAGGLRAARPAAGDSPARADALPRRRRRQADGARRHDRRARAARRQEPRRARAKRGAHSRLRASRRDRAHFRRSRRRSRHGEDDRAELEDAAHRHLRRRRDAARR